MKDCPPNKILNPITNRCVSLKGVIGKKLLKGVEIRKAKPKIKDCPPDKILNPITNRCVSLNGAIGKKLVNGKIKVKTPKVKTPKPIITIPEKVTVEKIYGSPNKNKFSDLIQNTFKVFPFDHSLDKTQIKKFIDACDPKTKEISQRIFDNTEHVSFEKFLTNLNSNIYHLISISDFNRPLFIYIDKVYDFENKSNYWLHLYVKGYISYITNDKKEVIVINDMNDKLLMNDDMIVLIDDCIYSGQQMGETIDDIKLKSKKKSYFLFNFLSYFNKESEKKSSYNFYLLVSYISKKGLEHVRNKFRLNTNLNNSSLINAKYQHILKSTNSILNDKEIKLMNDFYYSYRLFKDKYMIYFDHKLADTISTITDFYLGVVPNIKNKKLNDSSDYDKLDIIPVIKNCKHYIKGIDVMSPKCPAPPYKKTFKNFINIIKKDVGHKSLSFEKRNKNFKQKSY